MRILPSARGVMYTGIIGSRFCTAASLWEWGRPYLGWSGGGQRMQSAVAFVDALGKDVKYNLYNAHNQD